MTGAGQRRALIVFEKRGIGTSTYGKKPGDWEEQCREFCRIRYLRGPEPIIASRLTGTNTVVLSVPSSTSTRLIETNWRARDLNTGETFNVRSKTRGERNDELDIMCESGVPDG